MLSYYKQATHILLSSFPEKSLSEEEVLGLLEKPSHPEHGDIAFPCFQLAKSLKKSPKSIAEDALSKIHSDKSWEKSFSKIETAGPYINFTLSLSSLASFLLEVLEKKDSYGYSEEKIKEKILIEYSSPNIAKELHIGHLRSTILGESLKRIYKACGREVIALNHLGDWGTQFGKVIYAFSKWGDDSILKQTPMQHLTELYVRLHKEMDAQPEIDSDIKAIIKKLEAGDKETKNIWKKFIDLSFGGNKEKIQKT